jgi:hypothetical protein
MNLVNFNVEHFYAKQLSVFNIYRDFGSVFSFVRSDRNEGREGSKTRAMCTRLSSSKATKWCNKNVKCDRIVSGWKVKKRIKLLRFLRMQSVHLAIFTKKKDIFTKQQQHTWITRILIITLKTATVKNISHFDMCGIMMSTFVRRKLTASFGFILYRNAPTRYRKAIQISYSNKKTKR